MIILHSLNFWYDGISSKSMRCFIVNTSGGLFEETFLPSRSINEDKVNGRYKPYFKGVDIEPLSFSLSIFIEGWRDTKNLREIARWLFKGYYKPLIFESDPEKIYYAMFIGDSKLFHNGCRDGYITLEVRCDSPFRYSHPKTFSITSNQNGVHKTIFNEGDLIARPKLKITMLDSGNIKIINNTNNQEFIMNNLLKNEIIEADCANEYLKSSLEETLSIYRYENHNDIWLDFEAFSENKLTFIGDFKCELTIEWVYLFENDHISYGVYDY